MPNFAVLVNNVVTNIIVCDDKETAETLTGCTCIEYSDIVNIGFQYDESTNSFYAIGENNA